MKLGPNCLCSTSAFVKPKLFAEEGSLRKRTIFVNWEVRFSLEKQGDIKIYSEGVPADPRSP